MIACEFKSHDHIIRAVFLTRLSLVEILYYLSNIYYLEKEKLCNTKIFFCFSNYFVQISKKHVLSKILNLFRFSSIYQRRDNGFHIVLYKFCLIMDIIYHDIQNLTITWLSMSLFRIICKYIYIIRIVPSMLVNTYILS